MEIIKGSRKDYYPIGTVFQRKNGKCYEVVVGDFCSDCAFSHKSCAGVICGESSREDESCVIFIRRKDLESTDD